MEHPFDKEKAIILTAEKEHYVTSDKGETWRKFSVELPPSVRQLPVVFNAKNPDYVMYNGRDCEKWDFTGLNCKDKVPRQGVVTRQLANLTADLLHQGLVQERSEASCGKHAYVYIRAREQAL
jgi:hypothetical protein